MADMIRIRPSYVSSFIRLFARGDHCFDGRSERSFQIHHVVANSLIFCNIHKFALTQPNLRRLIGFSICFGLLSIR